MFRLAPFSSGWLTQTRFGRNIFAVGGNREAAILAGIRVRRVELIVYGLAGMLAALAGILYAQPP